MAASTTNERRSQVLVGDLPEDFLRIDGSSPHQRQVDVDYQTAQLLQAQQAGFSVVGTNMARLSITIIQARLTKNYGLTKMDPYCRIRVGHSVFETQTSHNGAKSPRWNKTIHCYLPAGVDSVYLEIFDERAFTMDDRVAWGHITIPQRVFEGETVDDWYPLNGKQGDGKEGAVNIVLTYTEMAPQPVAQPQVVYTTNAAPVVMVPGAPVVYPQMQAVPVQGVPMQGVPVQQQQMPPQGPMFTDEDVTQVKDMFPDVDEDVIKSILEVNHGDKDRTINHLLQMNS